MLGIAIYNCFDMRINSHGWRQVFLQQEDPKFQCTCLLWFGNAVQPTES
jgi:hypothetical protein